MYPVIGNALSFSDRSGYISAFPENYEARISCKEKIFADLDDEHVFKSEIVKQRKEKDNVLFKVEITKDNLIYLFLNESENEYRLEGTGNVSVKRNRIGGRLASMTVLLRNDPGCYAKMITDGEKSKLSIYLFDTLVYRDLIITERLEQLAFEPFRSTIVRTGDLVDWDNILGKNNGDDYSKISFMLNEIRKKLPFLDDVDDGVADSDGRFTYIGRDVPQDKTHGFNCSGFAKWVVDGFYYPLTGRFMDVQRLKIKQLAYRGTAWTERYEKERDPFFGLDWTRNCAITLDEARTNKPHENPEIFDVRKVAYTELREDIGFPIAQLELTLFLLARDYPGSFYLGSVNGDYGKNPVLRQHFHVVVLLPYFDDQGKFQSAVVERNKETSVDSLVQRFDGMYVHLVRIDSDGEFKLPIP